MSDEEKYAGEAGAATAAAGAPSEQPLPDEHTTVPNSPGPAADGSSSPAGKWQMPEPKFQQTSGYLPQGYIDKVVKGQPDGREAGSGSVSPTAPGAAAAPPPAEMPAAAPQPDLSEQLIPEEPVRVQASEASAKSGSSAVMIALGLAGVLVFIVAFLVLVYFLFLSKPAGGNNF